MKFLEKLSRKTKTNKEILMAIHSLVGSDETQIHNVCMDPKDLFTDVIRQAFDLTSENILMWCEKEFDRFTYARKERESMSGYKQ
jgi:hypothetical protein